MLIKKVLTPIWILLCLMTQSVMALEWPHIKTSKIGPNTYVIEHGPHDEDLKTSHGFHNNPGFVVTDTGVVVIDTGSTKGSVMRDVRPYLPDETHFVPTHPIAGTENSGPEAALLHLFEGKPQILCEAKKTRADLLDWAKKSFRQMGMYLRFMEPKEHDKHMAYVSHLSHISSFMLGKTVLEREDDEQNIFDLAGSGFESTVRLAKSSPEMWLSIFEDNKAPILDILTAYIENLENFRKQLEEGAYTDLYNQLKNTNQLKTILNGIKPN